jgi:hypothetical protein
MLDSKSRGLFALLCVAVTAAVMVFDPSSALAGVGGKVIKVVAKSFWVRAFFAAVLVILLPLVLYHYGRLSFEQWKTRRQLRALLEEATPCHRRKMDWAQIPRAVTRLIRRAPSTELLPAWLGTSG